MLIPLAGKNEMFLFQTNDFFIQIKLAGYHQIVRLADGPPHL